MVKLPVGNTASGIYFRPEAKVCEPSWNHHNRCSSLPGRLISDAGNGQVPVLPSPVRLRFIGHYTGYRFCVWYSGGVFGDVITIFSFITVIYLFITNLSLVALQGRYRSLYTPYNIFFSFLSTPFTPFYDYKPPPPPHHYLTTIISILILLLQHHHHLIIIASVSQDLCGGSSRRLRYRYNNNYAIVQ